MSTKEQLAWYVSCFFQEPKVMIHLLLLTPEESGNGWKSLGVACKEDA